MNCDHIMKRRVDCVRLETSVADAASLMKKGCYGLLPVCDAQRRVVGVITDRDMAVRVCAAGLAPDETPVAKAMSTDLVTCRASDPLITAEKQMVLHKKWRILVVDEEGKLAGIISLTDVAQYEEPVTLARLLRDISAREFRVEKPGLVWAGE